MSVCERRSSQWTSRYENQTARLFEPAAGSSFLREGRQGAFTLLSVKNQGELSFGQFRTWGMRSGGRPRLRRETRDGVALMALGIVFWGFSQRLHVGPISAASRFALDVCMRSKDVPPAISSVSLYAATRHHCP
jgi:hypothetical protein